MSCGLDGCPAFRCLVSEMASDDNIGLTSRDLAPLLLFTSFKFHLVLLTGTLTPSAKIGIKQFWSEGKENCKLKLIWEMSCLLLRKEKWKGVFVNICSCICWTSWVDTSIDMTLECTGSFSLQSDEYRLKEICKLWLYSGMGFEDELTSGCVYT